MASHYVLCLDHIDSCVVVEVVNRPENASEHRGGHVGRNVGVLVRSAKRGSVADHTTRVHRVATQLTGRTLRIVGALPRWRRRFAIE